MTLTVLKHTLNNQDYVVFGLMSKILTPKFKCNYTELEKKLFHEILCKLIKNKSDHSMSWNDIYDINDQNQSQHLTKQKVQELEEIWVQQGYLLQQEEKIYLGPRALLEYSNYFRDKFSEFVQECPLCLNLAFWVNFI